MKIFFWTLILHICTTFIVDNCLANTSIESFNKAKKLLERSVYLEQSERETIYCEALFGIDKNISLPKDFVTAKYKNRATKLEWEHIVPAENFGRTFDAWKNGHELCRDKKNKPFKGRKCAEKISKEFRYMYSDMYNLYPSIGAVNATRSNYNFTLLPNEKSSFGTCNMKIVGNKAEPPIHARGKIARTYLYMENTYARYSMSNSQQKLMQAWNNMYPVTIDECTRTKRIEKIQGNENHVVKLACIENNMW